MAEILNLQPRPGGEAKPYQVSGTFRGWHRDAVRLSSMPWFEINFAREVGVLWHALRSESTWPQIPASAGGRLIIRGSRTLVSDVIEFTQAGYTPEAVAQQYRGIISPEAVREAVSLTRRGVVKEVVGRKTTA